MKWHLCLPVGEYGIERFEADFDAPHETALLGQIRQRLPQIVRETVDGLGWGRRWYDVTGKAKRSAAVSWAEDMAKQDTASLMRSIAAWWNAKHPDQPFAADDLCGTRAFVAAAERLGILRRML